MNLEKGLGGGLGGELEGGGVLEGILQRGFKRGHRSKQLVFLVNLLPTSQTVQSIFQGLNLALYLYLRMLENEADRDMSSRSVFMLENYQE